MAASNVEILTKEYIQVVNRMTSLMLQLNDEKARATELEKLIEENNSLENEYKVSTLMVNQSNLSYFFWSIGALILIIFAIRLFYKEQ